MNEQVLGRDNSTNMEIAELEDMYSSNMAMQVWTFDELRKEQQSWLLGK